MSKKFTNPDDIDKDIEEADNRWKYIHEEKKKREKKKYLKSILSTLSTLLMIMINNNSNTDVKIDLKTKRKRSETSKVFDDDEDQALITHGDKTFLDLKQQELVIEFLQKYADNDNLYIFKNIFEQQVKKHLYC
jgi:hypothetical protein